MTKRTMWPEFSATPCGSRATQAAARLTWSWCRVVTLRWTSAMLVIASLVALAPAAWSVSAQTNGEVVILSSNGIRAVLMELGPRFERAHAQRLNVTYSVAAELRRRIESGATFDLAILTPNAIDDLIASGTIVKTSRANVARSGMALAVRTGAPRPDVSTVDALTRTLGAAKSIAYAKEGAGGVFFASLLPRLGLADSIRPALRPQATGTDVSASVARGEAELGLLPLSELISAPGVDVIGTFPAAIQGHAVMVAGIGTRATNPKGATDLVHFLLDSAAVSVLAKHGMERVP